MRVPCIMRYPGKIPAGTTCDAMLMTIDLFPTIARLVGAELPRHPIDGLDIWPILAGEPGATNPHNFYFFYYEQSQLQAVVTGDGRWKLQLPHTFSSLAGGLAVTEASRRNISRSKLRNRSSMISEVIGARRETWPNKSPRRSHACSLPRNGPEMTSVIHSPNDRVVASGRRASCRPPAPGGER